MNRWENRLAGLIEEEHQKTAVFGSGGVGDVRGNEESLRLDLPAADTAVQIAVRSNEKMDRRVRMDLGCGICGAHQQMILDQNMFRFHGGSPFSEICKLYLSYFFFEGFSREAKIASI